MYTTDKIDQIFEKVQQNNNSLSTILPMITSASLQFKDYEGFYILSLWGTPINIKIKESISRAYKNLDEILLKEGLSNDELNGLRDNAIGKYTEMRRINDKIMCPLSAKGMEDDIRRTDEMLLAVEVPEGLHPVDLYFRSEQASTEKIRILNYRKTTEDQYAVLQNYMLSKLTSYRAIAAQQERKTELEKGIENSKKVFIIHGRNEAKRRELKELLKDEFDLTPIILDEQSNVGSIPLIDKFENYATKCSYAFALFTPDDFVTAADGTQYFQVRPNVIFELGWFYAKIGRERVCILDQSKDSDKSVIFSDLQGVMRLPFKENIREVFVEIRRELSSVGVI